MVRCTWAMGLLLAASASAAEVDGTLDATFNGTGTRIETDASAQYEWYTDATDAGTGYVAVRPYTDGEYLHAYTGTGATDTTFHATGVQRLPYPSPDMIGTTALVNVGGQPVTIGARSDGAGVLVCQSNIGGCFVPAFGAQGSISNVSVSGAVTDAASYVLIAATVTLADNTQHAGLFKLKVVSGFLSVDTTFGDNGAHVFEFGTSANSYTGGIVVDNARVYIAGIDPSSSTDASAYVAAFDLSGNPVSAYGDAGVARIDFIQGSVLIFYQPVWPFSARALLPRPVVDSQGRIVVVVNIDTTPNCGFCIGDASNTAIGVARLTTQGLPDGSYALNGKRVLSTASARRLTAMSAVAIDAANRLIVAGFANNPGFDAPFQFVGLTRLTSAGADDCSFAPGTTAPCSRVFDFDVASDIRALHFDTGGRLLAAGMAAHYDASNNFQTDPVIARFAYDLIFLDGFE